MAGQQQQIIDTIFNMKRRLMRKEECKTTTYPPATICSHASTASDSEDSETPNNEFKHSLKRKAQYTRSGKPESASDPPPYKKARHLSLAQIQGPS